MKDDSDMVFPDDDGIQGIIDDSDGKVLKKLDYNTALLRQIDRVNSSMSLGKEHFVNAIECLEALTFPMGDDIYKAALQKLERDIMNRLGNPKFKNSRSPIMIDFALQKYKLIMSLLDRKGFFPDTGFTLEDLGPEG